MRTGRWRGALRQVANYYWRHSETYHLQAKDEPASDGAPLNAIEEYDQRIREILDLYKPGNVDHASDSR